MRLCNSLLAYDYSTLAKLSLIGTAMTENQADIPAGRRHEPAGHDLGACRGLRGTPEGTRLLGDLRELVANLMVQHLRISGKLDTVS